MVDKETLFGHIVEELSLIPSGGINSVNQEVEMATVFSRTATDKTTSISLVGQIIHVLRTVGIEEYLHCVKYRTQQKQKSHEHCA